VICDGFRGVGIGEKLTEEVLRESGRIGVWLVELTVFAINVSARRLYEKMGFVRVGVVPDKVVRGDRHFDEVIMYADLRKR
jgi:ribosomal protein S18 acetylase RimI-like enzyme